MATIQELKTQIVAIASANPFGVELTALRDQIDPALRMLDIDAAVSTLVAQGLLVKTDAGIAAL